MIFDKGDEDNSERGQDKFQESHVFRSARGGEEEFKSARNVSAQRPLEEEKMSQRQADLQELSVSTARAQVKQGFLEVKDIHVHVHSEIKEDEQTFALRKMMTTLRVGGNMAEMIR